MKNILKKCYLTALIFGVSILLNVNTANALDSSWKYVVKDGFNNEIYGWQLHANNGDVAITGNPDSQNKAIFVKMNKSEDFSKILNGVPRAEILLNNLQFVNNKQYYITFKTKLPSNYSFEKEINRMIFFQIHQQENTGSPPISLVLEKNNYKVASQTNIFDLGVATNDINKLITWEIYYKPSSINTGSIDIVKDGKSLFKYSNVKTAYSSNGYLKLGLYKWAWLNQPSSVIAQSLFYSDLFIAIKTQ